MTPNWLLNKEISKKGRRSGRRDVKKPRYLKIQRKWLAEVAKNRRSDAD